MFPEYQEEVAHLRANDRNFSRLYDKHAALDQELKAMEARRSPSLQLAMEQIKKQKLAVKQEIYDILREAEPVLALKQYKNYLDRDPSQAAASMGWR